MLDEIQNTMFGLFKKKQTQTEQNLLVDKLKNGAYLVDVRTPFEYSFGSVKNAINIPLSELENRITNFETTDTIVLFCQSGSRSESAKRILNKHGFQHVVNAGSWHKLHRVINSEK